MVLLLLEQSTKGSQHIQQTGCNLRSTEEPHPQHCINWGVPPIRDITTFCIGLPAFWLDCVCDCGGLLVCSSNCMGWGICCLNILCRQYSSLCFHYDVRTVHLMANQWSESLTRLILKNLSSTPTTVKEVLAISLTPQKRSFGMWKLFLKNKMQMFLLWHHH